jgi:hypothetical protein
MIQTERRPRSEDAVDWRAIALLIGLTLLTLAGYLVVVMEIAP